MIMSNHMSGLRTLVVGVAFGALSNFVQAETYPSRPLTMVIPFAAGGVTDTLGRATAKSLGAALGTNIVVTNKSGGVGTIGMSHIAKSKADGYTIAMVPSAPLVNQPNLRSLPYDTASFDYVCQVFSTPLALATRAGFPHTSLGELAAFAKQNPGALSYGTPGPGSSPHLAMEQLQDRLGIELRHVPFGGDGPGVTALMGGHIDLYFASGTVVSDKALPAIAVFSEQRLERLPALPTAREQGVDLVTELWGGVIVPKGVGDEQRRVLAKGCADIAADGDFRQVLKGFGTDIAFKDSATFEGYVTRESAANKNLIQRIGLTH